MSRISTLSAHTSYNLKILEVQRRVHDAQVQVSSEKKSQNYAGIASDTSQVVNLENERNLISQFILNNKVADLKLSVSSDSVEASRTTIVEFRNRLQAFHEGNEHDQQQVSDIQEWAYRALQEMQSNLNTSVDGQYVFAGGRVSTQPVDFGLSSLANFQTKFDGSAVTFPTQRQAHLANRTTSSTDSGGLTFAAAGNTITAANANALVDYPIGSIITISGTTSNDGTYSVTANTGTAITVRTKELAAEVAAAGTLTFPVLGTGDTTSITNTTTGNLTFATANTITAATAGGLSSIAVGSSFTVSGTASNNGTYTVLSNTGTVITIAAKTITNEGPVNGTVAADSYYNGDLLELNHRMDVNRELNLGVNAVDPAFEKAIRAMGIIAQGQFGTAGGLDQNITRVTEALYLLNDALEHPAPGTPPYGTEQASDIESVQRLIGTNQKIISDKNKDHLKFIGFLDTQIGDIENIDQSEAITRLLDESRTLQASFQTLAEVRNLSLLNFL